MNLKYLLDENLEPLYRTQISQRVPELVVWMGGDPNTPRKSTLDPDVLIWCEEHDFILVTNNRSSMPIHLADHLALGRHVPGILILNPNLTIGETIEQLILLAQTSLENEFRDRIGYLARL